MSYIELRDLSCVSSVEWHELCELCELFVKVLRSDCFDTAALELIAQTDVRPPRYQETQCANVM